MSRLSRMFEPLLDWEQEIRPLFADVRWPTALLARNEFPDLNVWDDERNAYVEAELPGLTADEFRIDVAGAELTISGERKADQRQGVPLREERVTGPFRRTIALPWEVEPNKTEATLSEGILTVRLPKSQRTSPRKIEVTTPA